MLSTDLIIPRSGSCRDTDPDYDPLLVRLGKRVQVQLYGIPIPKVISYNCDEGWIRSCRVNRFGKLYLVRGKVAEKVSRGIVTVGWL